jgi:plastocyanin
LTFGEHWPFVSETRWRRGRAGARLDRMRLPVLAALISLAAFGAPAASATSPSGPSVAILAGAYGSPKLDVLAGDTVTWRNDSATTHTVAAADGSFASARLVASATFSHRFAATGVVGYYCQIHPFMRAEVDVHRLLLDALGSAAPGQAVAVTGRSVLPAGTPVSIHDGDGTIAASAAVRSDGRFSATVHPRSTTAYTAVAGADVSPAVQVLVLDRKVRASARSRGGRAIVRTRVLPASPAATVVLQLNLRERFGWWPVKQVRLDRHSRARFAVRISHRVRARVVLTAADGATPLARSAVLRLRPR